MIQYNHINHRGKQRIFNLIEAKSRRDGNQITRVYQIRSLLKKSLKFRT